MSFRAIFILVTFMQLVIVVVFLWHKFVASGEMVTWIYADIT